MTVKVTFSGCSIIWNRLHGSGTEPLNIGWGVGTTTGALASDVALFKPSADAEARTAGTATFVTSATGKLADTYQVSGTITCATNPKTITEASLHDTASALSPTTTWSTAPTTTAGTTGTVASATGFPGSGNFLIQTENEVMLVTAGQGTTSWTVTRGVDTTTGATHSNGTQVTLGGDGGASGMSGATSLQTATVGSAQGGSMALHTDFTGIGVSVADSITFTFKVQATP